MRMIVMSRSSRSSTAQDQRVMSFPKPKRASSLLQCGSLAIALKWWVVGLFWDGDVRQQHNPPQHACRFSAAPILRNVKFQQYQRPAPQGFADRQQRSSGTFVEQGAEFQEFSALTVDAAYEDRYGKGEPRPTAAFWSWLSCRGRSSPPAHTQS